MSDAQRDRDRRLEPRAASEQAVHVDYVVPSPQVRDLSAGGLYLVDSRTLQLGQPIQLRLQLGRGQAITIGGMVRRVDPGRGMAIEFIQLDAADRRRIKEFVAHSKPEDISPAGDDGLA